MNLSLKQKTVNCCIEMIEQRIAHANAAMQAAQEAANNEDKSSAGDKYETSRAMGQLARDMNARQMNEALNELKLLKQLNTEIASEHIIAGSLVRTDKTLYFIGVGLGIMTVDDKQVIALSQKAPLTQLLLGKKTGDKITINKSVQQIEEVL